MLITRKIGSLIRGKATPFQVYAACILGCLIGFLPGFEQAPGLSVLWIALLLVLNANLFLAGIVTLLGKLVFLVTMPVLFQIGRILLEGPTGGIYKLLVNAPVAAYSGFDYYVVAGGQLVGLIVGIALGYSLTKALHGYRRKMSDLTQNSERLKAYSEKKWAKVLSFLFLGSGKGKKSYEELMSKKMGNPIRIWGLGIVVVLAGILSVGFAWVSGPALTSIVKSNLETANGATVDLESVNLSLGEGRMELVGLAMTDPQSLNTNLFASKRIVADVSSADLLRKRFSIDQLTIEDGAAGLERLVAGKKIGPGTESKLPDLEMPDVEDIGSIIENSDVWKERLAQVKRWLSEFGGEAEEASESWEDILNSRIQALGYAHVKADFLIEGSPTVLIRKLEARGVQTSYLDGAKLKIDGEFLSSHPSLSESPPVLSVVSEDSRIDAKLTLGGAAGSGANTLVAIVKGLLVDEMSALSPDPSKMPIKGGNMDIELAGNIGANDNALVARVKFIGSTATVAGNSVDLNGQTLAIDISGPIDSLKIRPDPEFIQNLIVSVGKKKLFDKLGSKLDLGGEDSAGEGDSTEGEKEKPDAEKLLRDLFN